MKYKSFKTLWTQTTKNIAEDERLALKQLSYLKIARYFLFLLEEEAKKQPDFNQAKFDYWAGGEQSVAEQFDFNCVFSKNVRGTTRRQMCEKFYFNYVLAPNGGEQ